MSINETRCNVSVTLPEGASVCELVVNGEHVSVAVAPHWTLLELLRYGLGLTGTKQGCDKGDCGACTVLIDGKPTLSCLVLALTVQGRDIRTVEGLSTSSGLHILQDAFDRHGAAQCGFCTPGMLMSSAALLQKLQAERSTKQTVDRGEISAALSGNLCRCTGYKKIIDAVQDAAEQIVKNGDSK